MDGENRRKKIIEILNGRNTPVSGTELAYMLGVSRQIVVQDIALLRADNRGILSTNKGYLLHKACDGAERFKKVFRMSHSTVDTLEELYTIVDFGGRVLDVSIEHELYGQICVDLMIENRLDAAGFVERMKHSQDLPLKALTGGCHYHTVAAASEEHLNLIEKELEQKGYLA